MSKLASLAGALSIALVGAQASAAGLESSMAEPPKFDVIVNKDFYSLERCLLVQNYGTAPFVYRSPDRPAESLLYFDNLGVGSMAVARLDKLDAGVRVRMWQGGKRMQGIMEQCF